MILWERDVVLHIERICKDKNPLVLGYFDYDIKKPPTLKLHERFSAHVNSWKDPYL